MAKQPNILFIFSDQQRWDTVGCYGSPMDLTPNLDEMAKRGVRFDRAFTCQPVCGPARALIMTGLYAREAGVHVNAIPLPSDKKTIAHYFGQAGYDLGYVGKWHLSATWCDPVPLERRGGWNQYWRGVDTLEFSSEPYGGYVWDENGSKVDLGDKYRVDALTDLAIEFLNKKRENPFFLFISYLEPHHQNEWNRFVAPDGYAERYRKSCWVPEDLRGVPGDWYQELPDYYGMVKRLDENVGRLLDELSRLGLADDTIVVYTSDHGCHFRTRNSEYKRSCHEASIRIPMIMQGPGINGMKDVYEMVSLVDIAPTLLDLAGLQVPEQMQGKSLKPLIERTCKDWENEVFLQISERGCGRAIRTERWKYCVYDPTRSGREPAGERYVEYQLYDLYADPHEKVNLAGRPEYRKIADELKERLIKRMIQAGEEPPIIDNPPSFVY